jgi:hypothetical protein
MGVRPSCSPTRTHGELEAELRVLKGDQTDLRV